MKKIVMLVALLLVLVVVLTACGDKNSSVLKIDGTSVQVCDTEAEAKANPMQMAKGSTHTLEVSDDAKVSGKALQFLPVPFVVKDNGKSGSKHDYTMDLGIIPFHTTIMLEVVIGDEDSFVGQRFGTDDAERYYLTVEVITEGSIPSEDTQPADTTDTTTSGTTDGTTSSQPSESTTSTSATTLPTPSVTPNGVVYFGEDEINFNTYATREEAALAARTGYNPNLSVKMVKDGLKVTGQPTGSTVRIRVKVHMVDDDIFDDNAEVVLNNEAGWSQVLDVSSYRGHRVTFMFHSEDGWALNNSYSYVTVTIPA